MGLVHAVDVAAGWVSQFAFLPDVSYLVLALLTTAGLVLPYRRFFSRAEKKNCRLKSKSSGLSPRGEVLVSEMLTNRTLAKINNRPREVSRLPLLAVGGGTLVLAVLRRCCTCSEVLPSFAILAVLGGGALLVLLLYRTQKAKTTISLSYKGNLDDE